MSILIVGANGNMGKRYGAILTYLGKQWSGVDAEHNRHFVLASARASEGVIIATPTATHAQVIRDVLPAGKPILCEKPVTKNVVELKEILGEAKTPFRMVYQYQLMVSGSRIGRSHYDYFRHGNDGLVWDCLQIIGLSRGKPDLGEASPVWRCMINGKALNLAHMDAAYIAYVQAWLKYPKQDPGEIIAIHEKVDDFERSLTLATN
jgi:hypothetical protein